MDLSSSTVIVFVVIACVLVVVVYRLVQDAQRVAGDHLFETIRKDLAPAGAQLHIRPAQLEDKDFFVAMASEPTAAEANGWSGEEVEAVRARFANQRVLHRYRWQEFIGIELATGEQAATATFSHADQHPRGTISIGVHVHPDHRQKGIGREMMAFAILMAQRIPAAIVVVGTSTTNTGMQKIMEQLGYTFEVKTRPYHSPNGETFESYWYVCTDPPVI